MFVCDKCGSGLERKKPKLAPFYENQVYLFCHVCLKYWMFAKSGFLVEDEMSSALEDPFGRWV